MMMMAVVVVVIMTIRQEKSKIERKIKFFNLNQ